MTSLIWANPTPRFTPVSESTPNDPIFDNSNIELKMLTRFARIVNTHILTVLWKSKSTLGVWKLFWISMIGNCELSYTKSPRFWLCPDRMTRALFLRISTPIEPYFRNPIGTATNRPTLISFFECPAGCGQAYFEHWPFRIFNKTIWPFQEINWEPLV